MVNGMQKEETELGLRVLSLFDGISCGQIALERAGIEISKYYASEIEPNAIKITQSNYPNTIQLGDITEWENWDIPWERIDLLIGGSPCQGFSFAGKQLNFNDPRSKLFFEYVDVLEHIRKHNPNVKFLLENVKMKKQYESVITDIMGVKPVCINSAQFSAQNRNRLYWFNWNIEYAIETNNDVLLNVLQPLSEVDEQYRHKRTVEHIKSSTYRVTASMIQDINRKCSTLCARDYKDPKSVIQDGILRRLTPIEYERLQTLSDNYTNVVCKTHRYECIGNGWTVDVIAHIFSFIPKEDY